MIIWIKKLQISSIALKDGKGEYGTFVINRQRSLSENSDIITDIVPSDWMKSLVSEYTNKAEKLLTGNKKVIEIYNQIKQCYANSIQAVKEMESNISARQSAIANIEAEIVQTEMEIAKLSKLLEDFYEGKSLPNGLTYKKINDAKTDFEQTCHGKQAQKESVSDLSSVQDEHDLFMKKLRENVTHLESDFSIQINLLYRKIRRLEIKYNEQISYYWQKLCKYIKKNNCIKKGGCPFKSWNLTNG